MTKKKEQAVKEYIVKENPSISRLEDEFPDVDRWTLRKLRADHLRAIGVQEINLDRLSRGEVLELPKGAHTALRAGFFRPIEVKVVDVPKVKPLFKKAGQEYLVFADLHAPDHDAHALDVMLQIGQTTRPDGVIIDGDGMDVHSLSKYTPSPDKPLRWVEERQKAVQPFGLIRSVFPDLPIDYIPGNHCIRPLKYIASVAAPLQGLFELPQLLGLDSLGFNFVDSKLLAANNLLIKHGTKVSKHAGYSVRAEMEEAGMSVIMGHVHRRALVEVTKATQRVNNEAPLTGVELGCLCNLKPDYMPVEDTANWQHGGAFVTIYDNDEFDIELIRIFNGRAHFRGRQFVSRIK